MAQGKYVLPENITAPQLGELLSSLQLNASEETVSALMDVRHKTRREKINQMLAEKNGETVAPVRGSGRGNHTPYHGDMPIKVTIGREIYTLGEIIDGISSRMTYLVIGVSATGMVCLRRLVNQQFKIKFYPYFENSGFDEDQLLAIGCKYSSRTDEGKFTYSRLVIEFDKLLNLITLLGQQPGMNALTMREIGAKLPMEDLRANIEEWELLQAHEGKPTLVQYEADEEDDFKPAHKKTKIVKRDSTAQNVTSLND